MAVAFPAIQFQRASKIELDSNRNMNRLRSGAGMTGFRSPDHWRGDFVTAPLDREQLGNLRAFFAQHGAGKSSVLIGHPLECLPMSYTSFAGLDRAVGGAFDGVGDLQSITDLMNITIDNLPAAFVMKSGDRIGIEEDGKATLHMVMADAVASGAGSIDLQVHMPIPLARTTAAKVRFEKPVGEFILDPAIREQPLGTQTVVSFSATSRVS